jgi:hypothetical protein
MRPTDLDSGRFATITPPKVSIYMVGDLGTSSISDSPQSNPSSVSLCRTRSRDRQRVTPFVIRLPGMSSDVYPRHLVVAGELIEFLPQIPIHHWLSGGGSPLCRSSDYAECLLQMPV